MIIAKTAQELNIIKEKTVSFTGHRKQSLPWIANIRDERFKIAKSHLMTELENCIKNGYDTFLCGMAIGCDMFFANCVLKLKRKNPNIRLIGAIPCQDQDKLWNESDKREYRKLLEQLDAIRLINENYTGAYCMIERNKFMIENSNRLIAMFYGGAGGTKTTIDLAKKQNIEIYYIECE